MPSQLKSRDELPWLYYPRSNSVRVINSHLVPSGGGGSLAVNGKTPVAAWVPSLDTAGNGTTTLTDLIGSSNGTLTNMDAGTDWVADTGAGGVRALDFDGTDDYVALGSFSIDGFSSVAFSWWQNVRTITASDAIFSSRGGPITQAVWQTLTQVRCRVSTDVSQYIAQATVPTSGWNHLAMTCVAGGNLFFYVNGTLSATAATSGTVFSQVDDFVFGADSIAGRSTDGLLDDFRIFDTNLDSSDIAYLYNSGSGRGRTS